MEQLGPHCMDFHEIWYLCVLQKSAQKIHVSLKSGYNNGYLTRRPIYIVDHISLNSSQTEKMFRTNIAEKIETQTLRSITFSRKSCRL